MKCSTQNAWGWNWPPRCEKLYPGKVSFAANRNLIGDDETIRALGAGEDPRAIRQKQEDALQKFLALREKYLLYR